MMDIFAVAICMLALAYFSLKMRFNSNSSNGMAIFVKIADSDKSMGSKFFNFARLTKSLNEFALKNTDIKLIKTVGCDRILFYVNEKKNSNLNSQVQKFSQHLEQLVSTDFNGIDYTIGCAYGQIMLARFINSTTDIFCDTVNCAARMAYLDNNTFTSKTRMCFAKRESSEQIQNLETIQKVDVKGKGFKIVYKIC